MASLRGNGIEVRLPGGWEGELSADLSVLSDGARRPTLGHFANFPLPPERGDFGANAVEVMRSGDALVVLFEYDSASAALPLFAAEGLPTPLRPSDFDRNNLKRTIDGQSGVQRFFHVGNRAFCLYVVVGNHIDRADALPAINDLLSSIEIAS